MGIGAAATWGLAGAAVAGLVGLSITIIAAGFRWPSRSLEASVWLYLLVGAVNLTVGAVLAAAFHRYITAPWPALIIGALAPSVLRGILNVRIAAYQIRAHTSRSTAAASARSSSGGGRAQSAMPRILRNLLLSLVAGGLAYSAAELANPSQPWSISLSVFVGGFTAVILALVGFERRLEAVEAEEAAVRQQMQEPSVLARRAFRAGPAAFSETDLLALAEASSSITEPIAQLARHASRIGAGTPQLASRLAVAEITRVADVVGHLADRRDIVSEFEDGDWRLILTRHVKSTIDAIAVDDGGWTDEMDFRFLGVQQEAMLQRGVRIRRLFLIAGPSARPTDPELLRVSQAQQEMGVQVRVLDSTSLPTWLRDSITPLVIFDGAISYERTLAGRLELRSDRVRSRTNWFEELWRTAGTAQPTGSEPALHDWVAPVVPEIRVNAYLDTNDRAVAQQVADALDAVAALLGYEGPVEEQWVEGSLLRWAKALLKRGMTSEELRGRLVKVERAVELVHLDTRQAEVDSKEAEAVARVITTLNDIPQACLHVGSILIVKYQDNGLPVLLTRNLSQLEIRALERYPEIQTKPPKVLDALATAVAAMTPADPDGAAI